MVLLESTLLVHVEKEKSLVSQRLTRDFKYPEPNYKDYIWIFSIIL